MNDTAAFLVAFLGGGGIFVVAGAIVTGLFSKRKLGAESTEIIQRAASGVVKDMERQIASAKADMADMKLQHTASLTALSLEHTATVKKLELNHSEEREDWRRVLQLHVAWDYIAIEKLSHLGIELPEPPPILPPIDRRGGVD
jgi:hypothetical protein